MKETRRPVGITRVKRFATSVGILAVFKMSGFNLISQEFVATSRVTHSYEFIRCELLEQQHMQTWPKLNLR